MLLYYIIIIPGSCTVYLQLGQEDRVAFRPNRAIDQVVSRPHKCVFDVNHLPAGVHHHLRVVDQRVLDKKAERVLHGELDQLHELFERDFNFN